MCISDTSLKLFGLLLKSGVRILQRVFTHSSALCEAWVDDAVGARSGVEARLG